MCPSCGGKRLEGEQQAWCERCGKISCPKCSSPRVIDGKRHSWNPPSLVCQICGFHQERPMHAMTIKIKREPRLVKCSTDGCDKMVETRNKTGKCRTCVNADQAESLKQRLAQIAEKRLARLSGKSARGK